MASSEELEQLIREAEALQRNENDFAYQEPVEWPEEWADAGAFIHALKAELDYGRNS